MDLVKLGGSVLTEKDKLTTLRPQAVQRLASEIAESKRETVVVHGAGSFGHLKAAEHALHKGYRDDSQLAAVAEVQRDVRTLNLAVIDAFREAGLHPIPLPPSAIAHMEDGALRVVDLDPFRRYRQAGFTPVTFGDVVYDTARRFSICSGDVLMLALAEAFRPNAAIFVADVDGVYTADPARDSAAKLVESLTPATAKSIRATAKPGDVTGGLAGKLERMFAIAKHVDRCILVNGLKKGRLLAALRGEDVVGTRVRA